MAVIFTANGRDYSFPSSLADVKFRKLIAYLDKVEPRQPELLRKITEIEIREAELTQEINALGESDKPLDKKKREELEAEIDKGKDDKMALVVQMDEVYETHKLLPYYCEVVAFWTGMPVAMLMGQGEYKGNPPIDRNNLVALYWKIIAALQPTTAYEYQQEFEINGEIYVLPDKLMKNGTVIDFMEAAQLKAQAKDLKHGHWQALYNMACSLLRKPGEDYSEKIYDRNQLNFQDIRVSTILGIAFFLMKRIMNSVDNFQIYTLAHQLTKLKQAQSNSGNNTDGT